MCKWTQQSRAIYAAVGSVLNIYFQMFVMHSSDFGDLFFLNVITLWRYRECWWMCTSDRWELPFYRSVTATISSSLFWNNCMGFEVKTTYKTLYMKVWKCPVMCDSYVISPAFLFLTNLCHLQYFVAYLCGWLFALLLGIQATGLRLCKGTTKKGSLLVHSCASKFSVLFFLCFLLCLALRNVPCRFFCTAEFATWFYYLALPIDLGGHRLEINKFFGKIAK